MNVFTLNFVKYCQYFDLVFSKDITQICIRNFYFYGESVCQRMISYMTGLLLKKAQKL